MKGWSLLTGGGERQVCDGGGLYSLGEERDKYVTGGGPYSLGEE